MMTIDVETLRVWLEEGRPVTILDVRPTAEWAEWAIPGSIHMDAYDALRAHDPAALADVDAPSDGPVVTVCAAGKTSQIAAEQQSDWFCQPHTRSRPVHRSERPRRPARLDRALAGHHTRPCGYCQEWPIPPILPSDARPGS